MNSLDIKLVKKLLNVNIEVENIETFLENYKKVKNMVLNYNWLVNIKDIPKLNKNRKDILMFIENNQEIIDEFASNDILYEMTAGFDISYHWEDLYKPVLLNIKEVGKEKVLSVIEQIENKNFKTIKFSNKKFSSIHYDKAKKKYNKDEYELEYYYTDGNKKYLARYYRDSYPFVLENAKAIFIVKENNLINNENIAILNTFDINFDDIKIFDNIKDILNSIPTEKIDVFTNMCEYLINIEKTITLVEKNIKTIKNLVNVKEIKDFYINELEKLEKQLGELKHQREFAIETYEKYDYDKDFIDINLKYLYDMEWQSGIDID